MGSFAYSSHVKSDNTATVVEAVRNLLVADGYETTDEKPSEDDMYGMSSSLRAVHVFETSDGWVSLLDSDMMHSQSLAQALSARLRTYALPVMVNDSDSWHYLLFLDGQQIDAFDSCEKEYDGTGELPESADIIRGGEFAEVVRVVQERAKQVQQQFQQLLSPEMQEIAGKLSAGRGTMEEMQKYTAWIAKEMPRLQVEINKLPGLAEARRDLLGAVSNAQSDRAQEPPDAADIKSHIEHLKPLLRDADAEAGILTVLGSKAIFAEEVLADFLPMVGIARFYAYLSYRYLKECTPQDLLGESVRLAEHLTFKKS